MTYQLDTSGAIERGEAYGGRCIWTDLDPFTQGYVEAVFTGASVDLHAEWLDRVDPYRSPGFSDLAPETLARIIEDCARFLIAYPAAREPDVPGARLVGGYVWTNRQGGDYPDFPPLTVSLGDDGKVYLREAG